MQLPHSAPPGRIGGPNDFGQTGQDNGKEPPTIQTAEHVEENPFIKLERLVAGVPNTPRPEQLKAVDDMMKYIREHPKGGKHAPGSPDCTSEEAKQAVLYWIHDNYWLFLSNRVDVNDPETKEALIPRFRNFAHLPRESKTFLTMGQMPCRAISRTCRVNSLVRGLLVPAITGS